LHNEIASESLAEKVSGVLKMDFKALIKTSEGKSLLVIIEVQKALKETNLFRFRQYLGTQYSNKNNSFLENDRKLPLPIFSIYILGYNIGVNNAVPIIKVVPKSYDYTEGHELHSKSLFIESLSHEMVIVQTKVLKNARRSLLEQFLSNFMPEVQQFLEVNPRDFDRKFVSLLKRLEEATMKKEIVELMQRENLLQEEWDDMVRKAAKAEVIMEEANKKIGEADKKLDQADKKLDQADKKLDQADKRLDQAEKRLDQANKKLDDATKKEVEALKVLKISVKSLFEAGISKETIAEKFQITLAEVEDLVTH
jgi:hypothetical protein